MDASFLIPCAREWDSWGRHALNSLLELNTTKAYEILICSPYDLEGVVEPQKNIRLMQDDPGSVNGAVRPINKMVSQATGQYCIVLNDEFRAHPNILDVLEIFDTNENVDAIALSPDHFIDGDSAGNIPVNYYPYLEGCPVLLFAVIPRELINRELGGVLFSEAFRHYGSDAWLSYYLVKRLQKAIHIASDVRTIFTHEIFEPSVASNTDDGNDIFRRLVHQLAAHPEMPYNTPLM